MSLMSTCSLWAIDWPAVVSMLKDIVLAGAAVVTATVAWRALQNWKRQDKAKRQADFLDHLTEAVQDFIGAMPAPVTLVQLIKIGMESYIGHISLMPKNDDPILAGAIEYIEQRGEEHGKRLLEALESVRPVVTHIRALAAKGNVFKFQNYDACKNDIVMLVWQFERTEALAVFIKDRDWYWENEEIIGQLKKLMAIDPEDIRTHLHSGNGGIITFVAETYGRIYG